MSDDLERAVRELAELPPEERAHTAEAAVVALYKAGVTLIPNVLDMTCGQVEALAGCWGVIGRWDVVRDRRRRFGDVLDALAFDGGEAPAADAALILGWLKLVDLIRTPQEADP